MISKFLHAQKKTQNNNKKKFRDRNYKNSRPPCLASATFLCCVNTVEHKGKAFNSGYESMCGSSLLECTGKSHVDVGQQTVCNRELLQRAIEHTNSSVELSGKGVQLL